MKRCPTCQKTFADTMRFCQIDGTELVEDAALPADPFKTKLGGAPSFKEDDDDLLQLGEPDPIKTFVNPVNFGEDEINFDQIREDIKKDIPPSASPAPFGNRASNEESEIFDEVPPTQRPKPNEPNLNTPPAPIPSPFDSSMPSGYYPPSTPPFGEIEQQKTSEPTFSEPLRAPNQSPFEQFQTPPAGRQMQQTEWTPPPAPEANWQNQSLGANTPFQPPAVTGQGQNQTLAIVSLVLGLISIPCCSFIVLGIAAFITGFLAKKKVDENPSAYGGRGLALAGMIIGGITTAIGLIVVILQIVFGAFANLR